MSLYRHSLVAISAAILFANNVSIAVASEKAKLPDSFTLVEVVQKRGAEDLTIPYKKYELDNGLTVILHEDDSDPLVHVDITYHVGSAREEVGKSGFAHFFEHMLFQGSENVADEQHFKIINESIGSGTCHKHAMNVSFFI